MTDQVQSLKSTATKWIMQNTIMNVTKMAQSIKISESLYLLQENQQKTTYKQAKNNLNKLEIFTKKKLEDLEGKCNELWTGILTDIWDEIDHTNQITSWDYREHISDYHGLEDGCNCFNEASDSILREIIRLLLYTSFTNQEIQTPMSPPTTRCTCSPPLKKRKLV